MAEAQANVVGRTSAESPRQSPATMAHPGVRTRMRRAHIHTAKAIVRIAVGSDITLKLTVMNGAWIAANKAASSAGPRPHISRTSRYASSGSRLLRIPIAALTHSSSFPRKKCSAPRRKGCPGGT